jgi:hypothetical protein
MPKHIVFGDGGSMSIFTSISIYIYGMHMLPILNAETAIIVMMPSGYGKEHLQCQWLAEN